MKIFEKHLEEICFEKNPTILDDDMPDFFENWLCELDNEQLIELAQKWGDERIKKECDEMIEDRIYAEKAERDQRDLFESSRGV